MGFSRWVLSNTSGAGAAVSSAPSTFVLAASDAGQSAWAWAPLAAAGVAGVFALGGIVVGQAAARKDRRRELYADAYKTALGMVEMVYRLRGVGRDNAQALADREHRILEDINFHQGWIETESQEMGRAYRRLVRAVRAETRQPLLDGWEALRIQSHHESRPWLGLLGAEHPDVAAAKRQFLTDVADYLSWTHRDRLRERYSDHEWTRIRATLPQGGGGTFYDPPG